MAAGIYDFTGDQVCEQGATLRRVLTLTNEDASVFVLTGYTARMQVRRTKESSDVVLSLTTENGRLVITALTGVITLLVAAEDTAELDAASYVYDLEIESSAGEVTRMFRGKFKVSREVTR